MGHRRVQHRQRQHRPGDHPAGQVGDLRLSFGRLRILRIRRRLSGRRPGQRAAYCRDAGTTWHGRGLDLSAVRRVVGVSAARGGLDDQRAVDHVHPAREPELPRLAGIQPHGGPLPGRQRGAQPEIGEHDAGGAVTGFLPVERQLDGHALAHPDHLGTVPAPDRDLQPLHPARQHRGRGLARPEEEPAQPGQRRHRGQYDDDVHCVHRKPPCNVTATLPGYTPRG